MSDTIKGEVASITEETNRTALLFRKNMFDEITTTNKKSCEEIQTIIRQAKNYYNERKTLDWAVIFLLIVNMFGIFMIARNIGMI